MRGTLCFSMAAAATTVPSLRDLFRTSLLLGAVGFGGGVSVLASIRNAAVLKNRWLTELEFDDITTIAQMLPGGAAANALAGIGLRFHGVRGAFAGYFGFVLPGMLSILALAWVYVRFGSIPRADAFLSGLNAAVVGIIVAITLKMLRTGVKRPWQMGVVAGALLLAFAGGAGSLEVAFLGIGAGLAWDLGVERSRILRFAKQKWSPAPPVALPDEGEPLHRRGEGIPKDAGTSSETAEPPDAGSSAEAPRSDENAEPSNAKPGAEKDKNGGPTGWSLKLMPLLGFSPADLPVYLSELLSLAVVFFRTGLGAYGGGFAIIPTLHTSIVERGWLTERQFTDAVAVGKLTPGPVLLMATFIGYVRDGLPGSIVATISILAAPFCLVVFLSTWLERVRTQRWMRAVLRGLTPAVVGLMMAAALTLGMSMQTGIGLSIAAAVALTLIRFEDINPVTMLFIGGVTRLAINIAFKM